MWRAATARGWCSTTIAPCVSALVDLSVGSVIGYSAYLGAPVARHAQVQDWLARLQARPAMQVEA